jgi:hypothetical protein
MSGRWSKWVRWVAHREPATPLALFRIAVGLVLLYTHGMLLWTGGVVLWEHRDWGGIYPLSSKQWLLELLGGPIPPVVYGLITAGIISACTLTIGLFGRLSALVGLQVSLALFSLLPAAGGGHDRLITNALFILLLAGCSSTLSVDARVRTGRWRTRTLVPAWPRYVLWFQLCLMYGITGVHKLGSSWFPWGGWSAVYYTLLTPSWTRYDFSTAAWVGWIHPLTQLGTAVSWLWEVSFPVVLLWAWWRHTAEREGRLRRLARRVDLRVPYALIGLVMHGSLLLLLDLGPFSLITLSFYVAMWHHDEMVRWLPMLGAGAASDDEVSAP